MQDQMSWGLSRSDFVALRLGFSSGSTASPRAWLRDWLWWSWSARTTLQFGAWNAIRCPYGLAAASSSCGCRISFVGVAVSTNRIVYTMYLSKIVVSAIQCLLGGYTEICDLKFRFTKISASLKSSPEGERNKTKFQVFWHMVTPQSTL